MTSEKKPTRKAAASKKRSSVHVEQQGFLFRQDVAVSTEEQIKNYVAQAEKDKAKIAELTKKNQILTSQLINKSLEKSVLETSTSWRMTAPFRKLLTRFPALRKIVRAILRKLYRLALILRSKLRGSSKVANDRRVLRTDYQPLVSVIIPNFNHARFLSQRLDCIINQSYKNIEIIVLDDTSTDNSLEVIGEYQKKYSSLITLIANEHNSGNIFKQWRKGIEQASGELIWICESDDFADPEFLKNTVSEFADDAVMMAFGKIQFAREDGTPYEGLDAYRERAEAGIWQNRLVRPAKAWFDNAFGVSNVIANVGGCLIRKQPVEDTIWKEATSYRVLGDWYLYLMLARGGKIAYVPEAVSYFRQHTSNTSVSSFSKPEYYKEHERLLCRLREEWDIPLETAVKFQQNVIALFNANNQAGQLGSLSGIFDTEKPMMVRHKARHILVGSLGFYTGGGEIVALHLANSLVEKGYRVSFLCLKREGENQAIRSQLDPRIAIYEADEVRNKSATRFLSEAGIDLIHTHFYLVERLFFYEAGEMPDVPYVVTLHGSYETAPVDRGFFNTVAEKVSHWVYLTDRNLKHLEYLPAEKKAHIAATQMPNGMPIDPDDFYLSRADLGIGLEDFVFAIVSRALPEKGWEIAIKALEHAQARTERRLVLLLCGNGDEADRLSSLYASNENVKFLGFQKQVQGIYRLSDCALLPTRFPGESFPLTLIQAMQVGKPVIATDIGEIASMLHEGEEQAGMTVQLLQDDDAFISEVSEAMLAVLDEAAYSAFAKGAQSCGETYCMDKITDSYIKLYGLQ
ncbi:glycosyltransferase [Microvirga sp. W0021]|uniref:Glycosyltransferase n=1 Tax=Hohaiivirga grylli TaxID=3133970 RepID=A0ABV0BJG5_9HYPH